MSAIAIHNSLPNTVLKAVIIYDDFDSATHATALLERVALRVDEATKWDIKPWRTDVLKQPALAALTVAVAAHTDLVVLALNRMQSTRPGELLGWLRDWAERRRVEDAAILILPSGEAEASSLWDDVKALAERQGLILLDGNNAGGEGNSAFTGRSWQRQFTVSRSARAFAGRLPQPAHWGINE